MLPKNVRAFGSSVLFARPLSHSGGGLVSHVEGNAARHVPQEPRFEHPFRDCVKAAYTAAGHALAERQSYHADSFSLQTLFGGRKPLSC